MKQTTKKLISMVTVLVFFIAAFVFYFDFIVPAYGDIQELKGRVSSQQDFFSQQSNTIKQVQKLIAAYQGQGQAQNAVELSVPPAQNISGALTQIYGIATLNNISIQNMSISVSSVLPSSGGSAIAMNAPLPLVKPMGSVSFAVSAFGSYGDFKNFLSAIETNARIFDVKNLSIQPVLQSGSSIKDLFNYNLTIMAYYQTL